MKSADEDLDYRPDAGVAVPGAVSGRAAATEDRGRGRYLRRPSVDGQECDGDARRRCETRGIDLFRTADRSEEHTSELQSLMRNSYAVFCLKKKNTNNTL